jgi:hypothetical protein
MSDNARIIVVMFMVDSCPAIVSSITTAAYAWCRTKLKQASRWVGWRLRRQTRERIAKVPYDART